MNQITLVTHKVPISLVMSRFKSKLTSIVHVSVFHRIIFLGMADIKACFHFTMIHADVTGAFGFIAEDLYNLVTAMVFGSTTSPSRWEAFQQAIKALTKVFANRLDLAIKHKKYLDIFKWEETDLHAVITPAFSCAINPGIINKNGK
jgi:hypothetical protein